MSGTALLQRSTDDSVDARGARPPWTRLALWYLASRVVVVAAVLAGWTLRSDLSSFALLRRLDAAWYLDVAGQGYSSEVATAATVAADPAVLRGAFFPLWPLLVRLTDPPGIAVELWATMLATALGFAVVVGSWTVVQRAHGSSAADRAALLVCCMPGSVVLSVAYAEALMLTLVVASLLAVQRRRWWAAGALAALATATRPNAIAIVPALAWAAVVAVRTRREWSSLAAPLLSPLGALAFHGYLWWRTGRIDAWQRIQRVGWDERVDFGARTLDRLWDVVVWNDPAAGTLLLVAGVAVTVIAAWAMWRTGADAVWVAYAAGVLVLAVVAATLGPRPRFVYTAVPLVWALGVWLRGEALRVTVMLATGGLAALAVVYIVGSAAKL